MGCVTCLFCRDVFFVFWIFSTTVSSADHWVPKRQTKHVPIWVEAHHCFPSLEIWHISDFLQIIFECVYFIKPMFSGGKKNSPEYYVHVHKREKKVIFFLWVSSAMVCDLSALQRAICLDRTGCFQGTEWDVTCRWRMTPFPFELKLNLCS